MTRRYSGWWVVAGSFAGLGLSTQMFIATGFTFLAAAIGKAFGWELVEVAAGASFFLLGQVIGFPVAGVLLDRIGTRRVLAIGIIGVALVMLLTSQVTERWQFYTCMFVMGVFGASTSSIGYLRALTLWFDRRRGLAIGVAACGGAIGAVFFPFATEHMARLSGWSSTLQALAALQLLIVLPIVLLLVRESPAHYGLAADGVPLAQADRPTTRHEPQAQSGGVSLTLPEALRTVDFWMLATVYFIVGASVYGVVTNAAHILSHTAKLGTGEIAKVQAIGGATVLVGRLLGGVLLDRMNTKVVAIAMNSSMAIGILGYALGDTLTGVMVAAFMLGFANGGEGDVLPFMVAKYFGPLSFGRIYGALGGIFALGAALGPVAYAAMAKAMESPSQPLFVLALCTLATSMCFVFVGRKPLPPHRSG